MSRVRAETRPTRAVGRRSPRPTANSITPPGNTHPKHREFARLAVIRGTSDPTGLARDAGFARPSDGPKLLLRLQDLIERERLAQKLGASMDLEEGLRIVGDLARNADDDKTKLAATRTVLEIHGALNGRGNVVDRTSLTRTLETLVAGIKQRASGGKVSRDPRVRARVQIDVDTHPDSDTPTDASASTSTAIDVTPNNKR